MARVLIAGALVLVALGGLVVLCLWPAQIGWLSAWITRTERSLGAAGWLIAVLFQLLIALSGVLPASIGPVAAGAVYGTLVGFLLSAPATLAAALISFLLSRWLFRGVAERLLSGRAKVMRLREAVGREGWSFVCLLRLSPIMPFAVTSYALGLTSLRLREYLLGTLASLPALFLYVLAGDLAHSGLESVANGRTDWLHATFLVVAFGATLVLTVRIGWIVARILRLPQGDAA